MQVIPIMAITAIMIIPPIIAFAFAQKHIIEGMSGALKG
jgi:multiple sugar transport system permease protein